MPNSVCGFIANQFNGKPIRLFTLKILPLAVVISLFATDRSQAKTFFDLQPPKYIGIESVNFKDGASGAQGTATLTNLNLNIGAWYILKVTWPNTLKEVYYHLEVPEKNKISLSADGLTVDGEICPVFAGDPKFSLRTAQSRNSTYVGICWNKVFLRKNTVGQVSDLKELVADTLRGLGAGAVVEAYKANNPDAEKVSSDVLGRMGGQSADSSGPRAALLEESYVKNSVAIRANNLNLQLMEANGQPVSGQQGLDAGRWYSLRRQFGVFASVIQPRFIAKSILDSHGAARLDGSESEANVYLVAFDLAKFKLGWARGTDEPKFGWSQEHAEVSGSGQGPDGFSDTFPLAFNGILNPAYLGRLVATMSAGFKRFNGVFIWKSQDSPFFGQYYGFMQDGTILSSLKYGLASAVMYKNGDFELKDWSQSDSDKLAEIQSVRQNGLAIVQRDPNGKSMPGEYVTNWGAGNWSGSKSGQLRTSRAAICLSSKGTAGGRYLIYAYFSAATPSALARVFQAYDCDYGMLLDMNSPAMCYLGILSPDASGTATENPVQEMAGDNQKLTLDGKTVSVPRWVSKPDQKDFFYILRK